MLKPHVGPAPPAPRKCFTASPRAARPRWFRILEWLDARRIFATVCESKRPKSEKEKECNTRTSQEVTHPSTTLAQARLTSSYHGIRCFSAGMIASDILALLLPFILAPRHPETTHGPAPLPLVNISLPRTPIVRNATIAGLAGNIQES